MYRWIKRLEIIKHGPKVEESARGGMKKKCEDGIGGSKSDATKRSLIENKEDKQQCLLGSFGC